jgi:hypothetical protein
MVEALLEAFRNEPRLWVIPLLMIVLPYIFWKERQLTLARLEKYRSRGFDKVARDAFESWAGLRNFSILNKHSRFSKAKERIMGEFQNTRMGLFLHSVSDGSKTGMHQTATVVELERPLPEFVLRPEWLRDKFKAKFMADDDIDFVTHETFSKKYFLQGPDSIAVRGIFNIGNLDYFSENSSLWVESIGDRLLLFREHDRLLDGERLEEFLERALLIRDRLQTR